MKIVSQSADEIILKEGSASGIILGTILVIAGAAGNRGMSRPEQVFVSQSVIVFKDGRELPLDHQKRSSSMSVGPAVLMSGQGTEIAIATQVANFLGVPFQEIAPPNSGMGINIGGGPGGIQL